VFRTPVGRSSSRRHGRAGAAAAVVDRVSVSDRKSLPASAVQSYISFRGTGNGYADVAAMLLVVYALGRQIGAYGKTARSQLAVEVGSSKSRRPADSGHRRGRSSPPPKSRLGTAFECYLGSRFPVDMRLSSGAALLHEASITGEKPRHAQDVWRPHSRGIVSAGLLDRRRGARSRGSVGDRPGETDD